MFENIGLAEKCRDRPFGIEAHSADAASGVSRSGDISGATVRKILIFLALDDQLWHHGQPHATVETDVRVIAHEDITDI
jgi:hypothetical protein